MLKKVHVIINPASGKDEPALNIMNRVFNRHGIEWDVSVTHKNGDGKRLARLAARKKGVDMIIAYGGDGTIMDVLNGIHDTGMPLGIVKGGTANAIATELGIANSLEQSIEQICLGQGKLRTLDLGCVGTHMFLLRADVGISSILDEYADRETKTRLGVLAYLMAAARAIPEPRNIEYKITVDGKEITTSGAGCVVVNIGSVGTLNLTFGSGIKADDGLMNVFVMQSNISTILGVAASIVKLTELEKVLQHWEGKHILIESKPQQTFSCDGEAIGKTPMEVSVLPGAMRVFVPA